MNKIIEIKNVNIESKCGWSPFDGNKFKGTPVVTIINEVKGKNTGFELPAYWFTSWRRHRFVCYALSFLLTDVVRALILFYMFNMDNYFEILFLKKGMVGKEYLP